MPSKKHLVVCVGLARSGSTLQYNLARKILAHAGPCRDYDYTTKGSKIRSLMDQFDGSENGIVKTHDYFDFYLEAKEPVVFLSSVRDFKQVASSCMRAYNMSFEYMMERMLEREVRRLVKLRSLSPLLMQKYSLLTSDLSEAIRQISVFLGVPLTDAQVAEIAHAYGPDQQLERIAAYNRTLRSRFIQALNRVFIALNPTRRRPVGLIINRDPRSGLHWNHIAGQAQPDSALTPQQAEIVDRLVQRIEAAARQP